MSRFATFAVALSALSVFTHAAPVDRRGGVSAADGSPINVSGILDCNDISILKREGVSVADGTPITVYVRVMLWVT